MLKFPIHVVLVYVPKGNNVPEFNWYFTKQEADLKCIQQLLAKDAETVIYQGEIEVFLPDEGDDSPNDEITAFVEATLNEDDWKFLFDSPSLASFPTALVLG